MLRLTFLLFLAVSAAAQQSITVDASNIIGPHSQTPLNTVGAGRAHEGLGSDWQAQLATVQREIGFHYIRFHGLLHDDMDVYSEAPDGSPIYNFKSVDALYDALLARHIRPFVELSFMPAALASNDQTIFWWKAHVSPPRDMARWNALITALVAHLRSRYGEEEINHWYFEVWNEPNLKGFFTGTQEDYFSLYRNTVQDIRAVCPHCRVGGPATAGGAWLDDWLTFIAANHVPADFLSTHTYAVTKGFLDANGHAGTILSTKPDAITGAVTKARHSIDASATPDLELHYTEWSSSFTSRDPLHDQYIEAAFILQKLRETSPLAQSMSYWTFTDIFEEAGPQTRPFAGGFGLLNPQGIRKPAFFAYKFLAQLGPQDLSTSDPSSSWATTNPSYAIQVLFWNYTAPSQPPGSTDQTFFKGDFPAAALSPSRLNIANLPNGRYRLNVYRTGYQLNDAYTAYVHMGSPDTLTAVQLNTLNQAASGQPVESKSVSITDHSYTEAFTMHQNDTVLVTLTPVH